MHRLLIRDYAGVPFSLSSSINGGLRAVTERLGSLPIDSRLERVDSVIVRWSLLEYSNITRDLENTTDIARFRVLVRILILFFITIGRVCVCPSLHSYRLSRRGGDCSISFISGKCRAIFAATPRVRSVHNIRTRTCATQPSHRSSAGWLSRRNETCIKREVCLPFDGILEYVLCIIAYVAKCN